MSRAGFLSPLLKRSAPPCSLVNTTRGTTVGEHVEAAFDSGTRRRGLLGRDGLPPDLALIIAPCSGVHTWFMRFPIDVIFVARDGRVLKARPAVAPWRIALGLRAFAVIEGAAGMIERSGTRPGDLVTLRSQ